MILSWLDGRWQECAGLFEAGELEPDHREILSLTGGGGKTTVIRRLQKECMERRIFHGVSTTTHMQYQKNESFLGIPSLESFLTVYRKCGTVWMGEAVSEKKMKGFSFSFLEQVMQMGAWLLLEADGARCLPVKAPEEHEPALFPETTEVWNVYGMDGLYRPIKESCFRSQKVAELLGKHENELLTESDLVDLAVSRLGGKKLVGNRPYHVILNKADTEQQRKCAMETGEKMLESGICHVHITSRLAEMS